MKKIFLWLKKSYSTHIRGRFFNKVFLTSFLIALLTLLLLFAVVNSQVTRIKHEQSLEMSQQINQTVQSYLDNKIINYRLILQRLYHDKVAWNFITNTLRDNQMEEFRTQYATLRQSVLRTMHSIDGEFRVFYAYSLQSDNSLAFTNRTEQEDKDIFVSEAEKHHSQTGLSLVSARTADTRDNNFSLFLVDTIHDFQDDFAPTGIAGMNFNAKNLSRSYHKFDKYVLGSIYVVTAQGEMLYDSQGEYQISGEELLSKIQDLSVTGRAQSDSVYTSLAGQEGEYYVIGAIPMAALREQAAGVTRSIVAIVVFVLGLIVVLVFLASRMYSKRLLALMESIGKAQRGTLLGLYPEKEYQDEIGEIHLEFAQMCEALNHQIEREYLYQIHQREVELYALQAQINPHFLYNTLESIRMNLLLSGEREASHMMYLMSSMFRDIINTKSVVSIGEELEYTQTYLELHKYRFEEQMDYHMQVDKSIYLYGTLKHTLQPLVENAVIHAVENNVSRREKIVIKIQAQWDGEEILLSVEDNGQGIAPDTLEQMKEDLRRNKEGKKQSIGLLNVNRRVRIIYGSAYGLTVESQLKQGTKVTLRLGKRTVKELEDYVQGPNR